MHTMSKKSGQTLGEPSICPQDPARVGPYGSGGPMGQGFDTYARKVRTSLSTIWLDVPSKVPPDHFEGIEVSAILLGRCPQRGGG